MIVRPPRMIVRPNLRVRPMTQAPDSRSLIPAQAGIQKECAGIPASIHWVHAFAGTSGESNGSISTKLALDRAGSPLARRSADELFERPTKRRFGFVADFMSDGSNLHGRIGKPLGGNLHAPLG